MGQFLIALKVEGIKSFNVLSDNDEKIHIKKNCLHINIKFIILSLQHSDG